MATLTNVHAELLHTKRRWPPAARRTYLTTLFLAGLVLAVIPLALTIGCLGNWCSMSGDGFLYFSLARELVESGQFPARRLVAPPGFPTLLAPLMAFGDLPFLGVRVLNGMSWAAACVLTFVLFRRELGDVGAWIAAGLLATNSVFFVQTTTVLTEPVFIAVSLGVLILLDRWWRESPERWLHVILGGLLTAACYMLRTMGIFLVPLMAVALLRHRRLPLRVRLGRTAVFAVFAIGPLIAWTARQSAHPAGLGYLDSFMYARAWEQTDATGLALQVERLWTVGSARFADIKAAILPQRLAWRAFAPPADAVTTLIMAACVITVMLMRLAGRRSPIDLYVLLTLLLLALWPWREGTRMIAPLVPIFYGYIVWTGTRLFHRFRRERKHSSRVQATMAIVVLGVFAVQGAELALAQSRMPERKAKADTKLARMRALAAWQTQNVPPGGEWLGVTRKWDDAKVLLLGSSYLSKRPVHVIDVYDCLTERPGKTYPAVFVHESLSKAVATQWGYVQDSVLSEFVVFAAPKD
ncbi:MAG: hypothetical protein O7B26_01705 [Planctomycetota bacterium]|nr:hypothetical protein [Planctomycetota bacterium]